MNNRAGNRWGRGRGFRWVLWWGLRLWIGGMAGRALGESENVRGSRVVGIRGGLWVALHAVGIVMPVIENSVRRDREKFLACLEGRHGLRVEPLEGQWMRVVEFGTGSEVFRHHGLPPSGEQIHQCW